MLLLYGARNHSTPFIYCPMSKLMWGVICFTFGITKPISVDNLFGP
jgi:hypothetical protein